MRAHSSRLSQALSQAELHLKLFPALYVAFSSQTAWPSSFSWLPPVPVRCLLAFFRPYAVGYAVVRSFGAGADTSVGMTPTHLRLVLCSYSSRTPRRPLPASPFSPRVPTLRKFDSTRWLAPGSAKYREGSPTHRDKSMLASLPSPSSRSVSTSRRSHQHAWRATLPKDSRLLGIRCDSDIHYSNRPQPDNDAFFGH